MEEVLHDVPFDKVDWRFMKSSADELFPVSLLAVSNATVHGAGDLLSESFRPDALADTNISSPPRCYRSTSAQVI